LEKAAASRHDTVRLAAAAAASRATTDVANNLLTKLVDDENSGVRKAALQSVPLNATDELHLQVARVAGKEVDLHLREVSMRTLQKLAGGPQASPGTATSPTATLFGGHTHPAAGTATGARTLSLFGGPAPATEASATTATKAKRTKAAPSERPRAAKKPARTPAKRGKKGTSPARASTKKPRKRSSPSSGV
jgi:hypothetical protein